MEPRKGARSRDGIPTAVLESLNKGLYESANLVEWLAVDKVILLRHMATLHPSLADYFLDAAATWESSPSGIVGQYRQVGELLAGFKPFHPGAPGWELLAESKSDSLRGMACYCAAARSSNLNELFITCEAFISDPHFGVRELVWMALRPAFIGTGPMAFQQLHQVAKNENAYVRRFSSELSRPIGVWTPHVNWLKNDPEPAREMLTILKSDSSRYVQDSVGNWLNDASKSQPEWVLNLTANWTAESDSTATKYIVKRGLRTLARQRNKSKQV